MFIIKGEYTTAEVFVSSKDDLTDATLQNIHQMVSHPAFEGTTNESANWSAPHGSGRLLKRSDAKHIISKENFSDSVSDVYVDVDKTSISEAPQAYKDPDFLLEQLEQGSEKSLAIPVDHLVPIHSIKY